jgi:outer membrane protein assembly factor BamA
MTKQNKQYWIIKFKGKTMYYRVGNLLLMLLLMGCTATRFLKDDESFYTGGTVKINTQETTKEKKRLTNMLQSYILPKPNTVILGARPTVWFYYVAGTPKKKKGLRNLIKNKLGKPPVLLSDATPKKTTQMLELEVNNNGYFKSTVSYDVKTNKKASRVIYTVNLQAFYRLRQIDYTVLDSTKREFVDAIKTPSLLDKKTRFRLDELKNEKERIEEVAKNYGYYYFDSRYLLFDADSTVGNKMVDVKLTYLRNMPAQAKQVYNVKVVNVFPDYLLTNDSMRTKNDTIRIDGFNYIDSQHAFRPKIITDVINVRPDSIYRRINHEYTISRLMGLKTFKFVNLKFTKNKTDSSSLDANIYLTPLLKKSVRLEVQAVSKSNNFVGPGVGITFTNRNTLRGAEMFQFKVNAAYEWQIGGQQLGALNAIEFGAEASLFAPRFISPIRIQSSSSKYLPQTQFKISYDFQQRLDYFRLASLNVAYGYTWRETTLKTHELFPADISFIRSSQTSQAFDALLEKNPTLANSFQNQFIVGSRYSFTFNTQMREDIMGKFEAKENRKSDVYFNATIDVAGNFLQLVQRISPQTETPYQLLGSPFSQFARINLDFRYYLPFNMKSKLVTRITVGTGYAYGNSRNLPYIKQFSVGGSNSIRAFPARSVGPGTYNVRRDSTLNSSTFFIDQRGDIKIESNVEYRFDILKSLKGAFFIDAGNIWMWNEDPSRQGSRFDKNKFLTQLAVGGGAGLRYDFNFFVLRFDVAFPLRKPYLPEGDRWVFNQIDFGSTDWRKQNLILNIAIGYPF